MDEPRKPVETSSDPLETDALSFPAHDRRGAMAGYHGSPAFRGDGDDAEFGGVCLEAHHVLIAGNVASKQLIAMVSELGVPQFRRRGM